MIKTRNILVTGFTPFGGERINPSWVCVSMLPDALEGCTLIKSELPVVWYEAIDTLYTLIATHRPHAVLCVGQSAGASKLNIERLGVNLCNGTDNDGVTLRDAPIFAGAPAAYFSTFPYAAMETAVQAEDIGVQYSFSAGTYLCNHVLYAALHRGAIKHPGMKAGFLHVPMLPEQIKDSGGFCMPLEKMQRGVELCVKAMAEDAMAR